MNMAFGKLRALLSSSHLGLKGGNVQYGIREPPVLSRAPAKCGALSRGSVTATAGSTGSQGAHHKLAPR